MLTQRSGARRRARDPVASAVEVCEERLVLSGPGSAEAISEALPADTAIPRDASVDQLADTLGRLLSLVRIEFTDIPLESATEADLARDSRPYRPEESPDFGAVFTILADSTIFALIGVAPVTGGGGGGSGTGGGGSGTGGSGSTIGLHIENLTISIDGSGIVIEGDLERMGIGVDAHTLTISGALSGSVITDDQGHFIFEHNGVASGLITITGAENPAVIFI